MMKQVPGCVLIGERTVGASGNPKPFDLGNGVILYVPSWRDLDLEGRCLEGRGVEPDIAIDFSQKGTETTRTNSLTHLLTNSYLTSRSEYRNPNPAQPEPDDGKRMGAREWGRTVRWLSSAQRLGGLRESGKELQPPCAPSEKHEAKGKDENESAKAGKDRIMKDRMIRDPVLEAALDYLLGNDSKNVAARSSDGRQATIPGVRSCADAISETEWEVMKEVWAGGPRPAKEIIEGLRKTNPARHPQTVKTYLNRLARKGALGFRKEGRGYLYFPLVSQAESMDAVCTRFLNRVFGGSVYLLLNHFLKRRRPG